MYLSKPWKKSENAEFLYLVPWPIWPYHFDRADWLAMQTFQHIGSSETRKHIQFNKSHCLRLFQHPEQPLPIGHKGCMPCREQMRMCLVVVTFWPGVPLHYAGWVGMNEERSIGVWCSKTYPDAILKLSNIDCLMEMEFCTKVDMENTWISVFLFLCLNGFLG